MAMIPRTDEEGFNHLDPTAWYPDPPRVGRSPDIPLPMGAHGPRLIPLGPAGLPQPMANQPPPDQPPAAAQPRGPLSPEELKQVKQERSRQFYERQFGRSAPGKGDMRSMLARGQETELDALIKRVEEARSSQRDARRQKEIEGREQRKQARLAARGARG